MELRKKTVLIDRLLYLLEIKSNYQIFKVEDRSISFVGYKIYHDYTLIRKNIKHKMCKKVAAMNKLKHMTYSEYRQQVCSHIGWMKHYNGINLLKKIIKNRYWFQSITFLSQ